ncbi:YihY/virulence factor BrkB family protein [Streptomyces armeniacus]|uniref:YihY/virulence factor BrkB family protein n=1 Tax=Streptomyces armeniacus TaxID=83291 RepID=A0A345XMP7_9ACTN|nr:YihY/virulence factor BrkB family protein [Streptomyces armeniacus]AXK32913.1 YihY/virulence factor BrkB family protein [Streptomyces armeniacus]
MEQLTKLPVIGPFFAWFFGTRVWRVYEHLDARKWQRLAAAITFTSFLAFFPMLVVGVAIGASFLSPSRMQDVKETIAEQVPGISDKLDIQSLADNAGTIGLVAGAALLFTGVNWAGTLRECLRAVWDLEEDPGNPVLLKAKDLAVLLGLGLAGLVSMAGSAFAVSAVDWVAERAGLAEGGVGTWLLRLAGYAAAVGADFLLLWYVLRVLPRVSPPRRAMVVACLIGAVGFELLKLLLGGYLQGVAAKNTYGAFGVPIALLLWISFMTKLLLYCAGWTATEETAADAERSADAESDTEPGSDSGSGSAAGSGSDSGSSRGPGRDAAAGPGRAAATGGAPRTRPSPAPRDSRP